MKIGIDTTFLIEAEILEHPHHNRAVDYKKRVLDFPDSFILAPKVLEEFIHIITDPKRFERPLAVEQALFRAHAWWNGLEIKQVFPSDHSVSWFLAWMGQYKLGRKRILDTMLAAVYYAAGAEAIVTSNRSGFDVFKELQVIVP